MGKVKIAYSPEFRLLTRRNPSAIREFVDAHKKRVKELGSGGLHIKRICTGGVCRRDTWKVTIGAQPFFVKETSPEMKDGQDGHTQFATMDEMSRKMGKLTDRVEVAKFHFGLQERENKFHRA